MPKHQRNKQWCKSSSQSFSLYPAGSVIRYCSSWLYSCSLEVFRHGDRTPVVNFPTDLHKESEWPQGFGQLTKTGMQQLYELGQYMRKRYSSFLNSTYNRQEFYIQSTDYDRTIMSAQSCLSGLFPPTSSQIWNPELPWQPIPVHIVSKSSDRRLHFPLNDCPRFDELQNETQTSSEFQSRIQPYMVRPNQKETKFKKNERISNEVGGSWDGNQWKKKYNLTFIYHQGIHNYSLPVWATKDVMEKMKKLAELSLLSLFGVYKTEEKSRLQGGKARTHSFQKGGCKAYDNAQERKMEVYSAHDTTVGALQIALNIFNGKLPPYAACQFFELYQESSGRYSIEMYYRNDTSKDPYLLTLPGCTSSCPLEKFAELVSPMIAENWSKECGKKDKVKGNMFIGFDVAVGLLFIVDLVLLYLLYHYGRCRRRNNYQDL
uniref:acid phosphatase n=1 Tax=Nothoprocta perdicaria TaxID=30464 RepID=A0A8C6YRJ3_NOTPE